MSVIDPTCLGEEAKQPAPAFVLGGDVIEVIERAKRMVADKCGVPVSDVRISVDFITPHGASASAEPPFTLDEIHQAEDDIAQIEADRSANAKEGA
jgi:hypothetical protein